MVRQSPTLPRRLVLAAGSAHEWISKYTVLIIGTLTAILNGNGFH